MMKRLLSLAMVCFLCLSLLPIPALGVSAGSEAIPVDSAHFPDDNFRACVEKLPGAEDGKFTPDELSGIAEINCRNKNISSLKGIEYFTALASLDCSNDSYNGLSTVDLSRNPRMTRLVANFDKAAMTVIVPSGADTIWNMFKESSGKDVIRVIVNDKTGDQWDIALDGGMWCVNEDGIGIVTFNEGSSQIEFDYNGRHQVIKKAPIIETTGGIRLNDTNFPDAEFRRYLKTFAGALDNVFTHSEIAKIKNMTIPGFYQVKDMTGIGYFTSLTSLFLSDQQLSSLDLSENTELTSLTCRNNGQLENLILSDKPELETLDCSNCNLNTLDLSGCASLQKLHADFDSRTMTITVPYEGIANGLTAGDPATNIVTAGLSGGSLNGDNRIVFDENSNEITFSYNNHQQILKRPAAPKPVQGVFVGADSFPDPVFLAFVEKLPGAEDHVFTPREISKITDISCSGKSEKISSLKGIEYFKNLKTLDCSHNSLAELDVSKNTALQDLNCSGNLLTDLNLSKNVDLRHLNVSDNRLKELNVFRNTTLIDLNCCENEISRLNLSQHYLMFGIGADFSKRSMTIMIPQSGIRKHLEQGNMIFDITVLENGTIQNDYFVFDPGCDTMNFKCGGYQHTFRKAGTLANYTVKHLQEQLDGQYAAVSEDTQILEDTIGKDTAAQAKTYTGFTAKPITQKKITADGRTVVEIQYERNTHTLTWDLDGGEIPGSYMQGSVKYGTPIQAPVPSREGYVFQKWDPAPEQSMPDADLSCRAVWTMSPDGWGDTNYGWSKDHSGSPTCLAEKVYQANPSVKITSKAVITAKETPATCTESGSIVYTAVFSDSWAKTQTAITDIPELGHEWGKTSYQWSTDYSSCTATRVCTRDSGHIETAHAAVDGQITQEPTLNEKGEKTYTAKFKEDWAADQTATVEIPTLTPVPRPTPKPDDAKPNENKDLVVDASHSTTAEIGADSIQTHLSQGNKDAGLKIQTKEGTAEYDGKALQSITEKLKKGDSISVTIRNAAAETSQMTPEQKTAAEIILKKADAEIFRLSMEVIRRNGDREEIHDFGGGMSTITISYQLPKGKRVQVFRLEADGTRTPVKSVYDAGRLSWFTSKHSFYAVFPEDAPDGWDFNGRGWFFRENGQMVISQWRMDSQGWCYLGSDGYLTEEAWVKDSVGWCYLDEMGRQAFGRWARDSMDWCYVGDDGYLKKDSWQRDSQGWLYLGDDGRIVHSRWVRDSKDWCYVGADGYCRKNCWVKDSHGWCYVGADGRLLRNGYAYDSAGRHHLNAEGHMDW